MKKKTELIWVIGITIALVASFLIALGVGRYSIPIKDCVKVLLGMKVDDPNVKTVLYKIRLPRSILAIIAGAGLAVAGAAFQSMFSNPLATPDTLGVATGASFGATLGIMLRLPSLGIQGTAFAMGLLSVWLVYMISRVKGESSLVMLILSGMVISSLFEALVSLKVCSGSAGCTSGNHILAYGQFIRNQFPKTVDRNDPDAYRYHHSLLS